MARSRYRALLPDAAGRRSRTSTPAYASSWRIGADSRESELAALQKFGGKEQVTFP